MSDFTSSQSIVVDPDSYNLIEIDGSPYHSNGQIYLQRIADDSIVIVPLTSEIKEMFLPNLPSGSGSAGCTSTKNEVMCLPSTSCNKTWGQQNILALIDSVKSHQAEFKSTTVKNETVWKHVSNALAQQEMYFTPTQCRDKYKYLKGKYTKKKKDNMGARGTGEGVVKFEYFEELDEFLGERHHVVPPALASNLRQHEDVTEANSEVDDVLLETERDDETAPRAKKKKVQCTTSKSRVEHPIIELTREMTEKTDQREASTERRHQENLQSRREAMQIYSEKMDEMIKLLASRK